MCIHFIGGPCIFTTDLQLTPCSWVLLESRQTPDSQHDLRLVWRSTFHCHIDKNPKQKLTEKNKKMLQTCQRMVERRILHVLWSNMVTNVEIRKRNSTWKWLKVSVEMGRLCGRNRLAQRGATYSDVGLKNGQNEGWTTEDPLGGNLLVFLPSFALTFMHHASYI